MSDEGQRGRRVLEEPPAEPRHGSHRGPLRRPRRVTLLVGAGVLVLALVVAGIVVAIRSSGPSVPSAGGSTGTAPPSSGPVSVPPATSASDAVRGYLQALAAHDADRALSYADTAPADRTLLSRTVLQASAELAPLGAVVVPELTDENVSRVPARFSLGTRAYQRDFQVTRAGDGWKVKDAVSTLELGPKRRPPLKMIMNGVEVGTSTVTVFPGTYAFSTGSPWVSWGPTATITVADPRALPAPAIMPTLTRAGRDTVLGRTRATFQACLAQHQLAPAGCPNRLEKSAGKRIVESSVRWRVTSDPFRDAAIGLDPANPTLARGRFRPHYRIKATVKSTDQAIDADILGLPSFQAVADLTTDPVAVTLVG